MADAKEVIIDARAKIKSIAARMLVRKESLERELEAVRKAKPQSDAAAAFDAKIATLEEALGTADQDYRDALKQLDELADLAKDAERAQLRALIDSAAPSGDQASSASEIALQNVREHIAVLEARVGLEDAISAEKAPAPAPNAEERARRQLAELKARRRGSSGSSDSRGTPAESEQDTDDKPGHKGPKRTL
jgi:hypothetical protein